jgi:hypothetical protein
MDVDNKDDDFVMYNTFALQAPRLVCMHSNEMEDIGKGRGGEI